MLRGYRVFYTGLDGHVRYASELHCATDDEVIETVSSLDPQGHGLEIWEGARRLAVSFPHPASSLTS
jgi:hypothetical protein